ncbi:MAG TPA: aminotransferase class I/II-fold pyridoxal phosphate-dependent enzyme, partial [Dermatophilaceae bacterium]|nr:aminotransferase class I/II-fold pyridoxal phosphate-dependent enzyme [Dermatophilaceae bacterium]
MTPSRPAMLGGDPSVTVLHPQPWPTVSLAARAVVNSLLDQGELSDYSQGEVLSTFDEVVRQYHGVPHVLGTSSGTAALHAAFHGVGIGPGDEVIVPSYSFHATVAPLFLLSAVPVLCDVDPDTGVIDLADAANRITDRTRAIAVTHMWGHPADMDRLRDLADRHHLMVVEDGSHAHGARYRGRLVGTFGDAAVFSLGARKMVSGGTAGVLLTQDERVLHRALPLGHSHERAALTLPAANV